MTATGLMATLGVAAALFVSVSAACAPAPAGLRVVAENRMPKGWGAGGWGSYRISVTNGTSSEATLVRWDAHWEVGGKRQGDAWGGEVGQAVAPGKSHTLDEAGVLPVDVARAAGSRPAAVAGTVVVRAAGAEHALPYRFEVPEYVLAEPLRRVTGKTVAIEVMESRYRDFRRIDRTLAWIDQCYAQMIDLTGERPYGGQVMVFKEAPPHPWWAYAGQEMILNTDYVGSTLKEFDDGLISFGWVHEVGHNFDEEIGEWYNWSGAAAEWQANFKLCYAFETIADQSFRIRWTFQAPGYPAPDEKIRLTGHDLVERFFLVFGDAYLADPSRTWQSLSSDEMHAFFQRLQRVYGWDIFKRWYRTYRRLKDAGRKPPETDAEKVQLVAAILSKEAGVDLVPVFARWRFPVSADTMEAAAKRYGIERPTGPRKGADK